MHTFPNWLPIAVRLHAEDLIQKGGLNTLEALLLRLVSNTEMESVWKKLSSISSNPQKLIDFLEYVRLHPVLLGNSISPIAIPSDKLQRSVFNKLSDLTLQMISEMARLNQLNDAIVTIETVDKTEPTYSESIQERARRSLIAKAQSGWSLLEIALKRAELHTADHASQDKHAEAALLEIINIQGRLFDAQEHESIFSLLELFRSALGYASTAPDALLPKKRNTVNAKRNLLILELKNHLKQQFNTESASIIAAIVNSAFNSTDGGVTEDDVRKLKSPT